uniref:Uncharacterized protein n=1 Tax=Plectus sambesii TaxID=2011161 RepID=A0A914XEZ3_9BILA
AMQDMPMSDTDNMWLNHARLMMLSKRFHATQGMRYMDPAAVKNILGMYDKRTPE